MLGLVYAGLSAYYYIRFERDADLPRLPIALSALVVQYVLAFVLPATQGYLSLPIFVMFFIGLALIIAMWLGLTARSRAGTRAALSGMFAFAGYVFFIAGSIVGARI